ncbi:MAG: TonB family protein [Prevotellaceae bacterium]|jgi:protein TonB|nr:TonB family protein [Prevotellaceae bacterium]
MGKEIKITGNEWISLVFAGKNKAYGAYAIRKNTTKRHLIAYAVIVCLAIVLIFLPRLMEWMIPERADDVNQTVTELSNIQLDVPEENITRQFEAPPPPPLKSTVKFTTMEIKDDKDVAEEEVKTMEELTIAKEQISVADVQGTDEEEGEDIANLREHKVVMEAKEEEVFDNAAVEQQASFPGGEAELMKWLGKNLDYPDLAIEMGLSGRITVQFEVSKEGKIRNIKILKGVDKVLDDAAKRTIEKMPQWIPARQGGRAVPVKYILPVVYRFEQR